MCLEQSSNPGYQGYQAKPRATRATRAALTRAEDGAYGRKPPVRLAPVPVPDLEERFGRFRFRFPWFRFPRFRFQLSSVPAPPGSASVRFRFHAFPVRFGSSSQPVRTGPDQTVQSGLSRRAPSVQKERSRNLSVQKGRPENWLKSQPFSRDLGRGAGWRNVCQGATAVRTRSRHGRVA